MKKITLIVIVILAAAGGYLYFSNNKSESTVLPREGARQEEVNTSDDSSHDEMDEDVNPASNPTPPTPPPAATPPPPVMDDPGDIDVAPPKVFNLTGENFKFSQTEIRVKRGDRVLLNFESTTGTHDWTVDEFNAKTATVNPGQKTSVEFIADKTGTFVYYCSVGTHRALGMVGSLIVE